MVIDSHIHFWKYDKNRYNWITSEMKLLRQDYLPENISMNLKRNNVDGCVAVQADDSELETHFLTELAGTHNEIRGVVGWVDLEAEAIEERLAYFSQYPVIKGWRYGRLNETNDFLLKDSCKKGIAALSQYNYTFDLLLSAGQLLQGAALAAAFHEQTFILDHCGKPAIVTRELDNWKTHIKILSDFPNVYCKLSGLLTETKWKDWSPSDFYPYLDTVFEYFGTDRLLFGSDWPVMLLSGMYVQWKSLLEKYMENYQEEDRQKVFGENAMRIYKL